jgi:hypothetical protein
LLHLLKIDVIDRVMAVSQVLMARIMGHDIIICKVAVLFYFLFAVFLSELFAPGAFSEDVWLTFCDVLKDMTLFCSVIMASSASWRMKCGQAISILSGFKMWIFRLSSTLPLYRPLFQHKGNTCLILDEQFLQTPER